MLLENLLTELVLTSILHTLQNIAPWLNQHTQNHKF